MRRVSVMACLALLLLGTGCRGAVGMGALVAGAAVLTTAAVVDAAVKAEEACSHCAVHPHSVHYAYPYAPEYATPACAPGYFFYDGYCYHAAYYRPPDELGYGWPGRTPG